MERVEPTLNVIRAPPPPMEDDQEEGRRQMKRFIQQMYDPCETPDPKDIPVGLVHYDDPIRLRSLNRGNKKAASCQGRLYNIDFPLLNSRDLKELQTKHRFMPYTPPDIEILLHNVRPMREFRSLDHPWRQMVSNVPGSRSDIWELKDTFPKMLFKNQSKNIGICYNRRRVYDECFDELIRQDILDIPERGVLMLRIRDEIRKSMGFLKHMFAGNTAYGLRKAVAFSSSHLGSINVLLDEQMELAIEKQTLEIRFELMKRKFQEETEAQILCHEKTCTFLKSTIDQLQVVLELYKTPLIKLKGSTQSTAAVEKAWEKHQSRSMAIENKNVPLVIHPGKRKASNKPGAPPPEDAAQAVAAEVPNAQVVSPQQENLPEQ